MKGTNKQKNSDQPYHSDSDHKTPNKNKQIIQSEAIYQTIRFSSSNKKYPTITNNEINPFGNVVYQDSVNMLSQYQVVNEDKDKLSLPVLSKQTQSLIYDSFKSGTIPNCQRNLVFTKKPNYQALQYGQLFPFNLNQKNSKNLVYNPLKGTMIPTYQCRYCKKIYFKASGLGGHISKCKERNNSEDSIQHIIKLQQRQSKEYNKTENKIQKIVKKNKHIRKQQTRNKKIRKKKIKKNRIKSQEK